MLLQTYIRKFKSSNFLNLMENFNIVRKIGEGTFSKVYLAKHIPTNMQVAMKAINKNRLKNKKDRLMIEKEIAIHKDTYHENICQMYQLFQDQQFIYIVLQYMQRDNLLTFLKAQNKQRQIKNLESSLNTQVQIDYSKKILMFIDIVRGVKYLHSKRIVHRDIKLANILIGKDQKPKLADFGLSSYYSYDQMLKTSCGSPCFAAPELLLGKPYFPEKIDVWSLGVVFYCMLVGTFPFYDENIKIIYDKVCSGKYHCPQTIPKSLQILIRQMLEISPQKRMGINQLYQKLTILTIQLKLNNISSKMATRQFLRSVKSRAFEYSKQYIENFNEQIFQLHCSRNNLVFGPINTIIKLNMKKAENQIIQQNQSICEQKIYASMSISVKDPYHYKNSNTNIFSSIESTHSQHSQKETNTSIANKQIKSVIKEANKIQQKNQRFLKRNFSNYKKEVSNHLIDNKNLKRSLQLKVEPNINKKIERTKSPINKFVNKTKGQNQKYIKLTTSLIQSILTSEIEPNTLSHKRKIRRSNKLQLPAPKNEEINLNKSILLELSKSQQKLNLIKTIKYVPTNKKFASHIK